MSDHPERIEDYPRSLEDLAREISYLKFDKLSEFLNCLSDELLLQSKKDLYNKKTKLATCLSLAEKNIKSAALSVDDAWRISKPYMKDNIK